MSNAERFAQVPVPDPGTPPEVWQRAVAELPELDIEGWRRVFVVVAHPDDELFGAGGLLWALRQRGSEVHTLIATDGERSHPGVDPTELGRLRRIESTRAAELLGIAPPSFLGLPDGGLVRQELEERIAAHLDATGTDEPPVLVTPWWGDGHPDHEVVGRACTAVGARLGARVVHFPLWAMHWDAPGGQFPILDARRWPVAPARRDLKRRAASLFTTQVAPFPDPPGTNEPIVPPHVVERWVERDELFLVEEPVDSLHHLAGLYAEDSDPWGVEDSDYEHLKRQRLLAALPHDRYRQCFEPGCGRGVLTAELRRRCDRILAWEPVDVAFRVASERFRDEPEVRVEHRVWDGGTIPPGTDLVVFSEMLYYLTAPQLEAAITSLGNCPGTHVACVHWRHPVAGWPRGGHLTHEALAASPRLRRIAVDDDHPDFLVEVFETIA